MIIRKEIEQSEPLSEVQRQMIEELKDRPIVFDEDCPELTSEQLAQMRRVSEEHRVERCKQSVTLRLSPQALRTAKSLGKGYTSVLSRILESTLRDADRLQQYL